MNTTETKKLTFRTTHPKANRKVVAAVLSAAISLGTLGLSPSPAHSLWCRTQRSEADLQALQRLVCHTPGAACPDDRRSPRLGTGSNLGPPCPSRGVVVVGEGGLEPPRPCGHWHLKPARLPFRHSPEWRPDASNSCAVAQPMYGPK